MTKTGPRKRWKNRPRLYKNASRRTDWKQRDSREAACVVKGTNRRVIVVKSPDPQIFEEAIFVVREDFLRQRNAEQVLEEARRAAGDYLKKTVVKKEKKTGRIRGPLIAAAGAVAASIAWITMHFVGV